MALTVILILVMIAITGMATREIVLFRQKRAEYSLRRLTLRLTMAIMLTFQLASVLVGVRVFHLDNPHGVIGLWMAFWGCIALLTGAITCLALADMRLVSDETSSETNRIWRDIAEMIAQHDVQYRESAPPGEQTERTDERPSDGG